MVNRPYLFKFFKGFLPQTLLGPFLNTLSNMKCTLVSTFYLRFNGNLIYTKLYINCDVFQVTSKITRNNNMTLSRKFTYTIQATGIKSTEIRWKFEVNLQFIYNSYFL